LASYAADVSHVIATPAPLAESFAIVPLRQLLRWPRRHARATLLTVFSTFGQSLSCRLKAADNMIGELRR